MSYIETERRVAPQILTQTAHNCIFTSSDIFIFQWIPNKNNKEPIRLKVSFYTNFLSIPVFGSGIPRYLVSRRAATWRLYPLPPFRPSIFLPHSFLNESFRLIYTSCIFCRYLLSQLWYTAGVIWREAEPRISGSRESDVATTAENRTCANSFVPPLVIPPPQNHKVACFLRFKHHINIYDLRSFLYYLIFFSHPSPKWISRFSLSLLHL